MKATIKTAESEESKHFEIGFKTIGLFGSVQFIKIILSIVNSKFVAVLLGPYGMGVKGLFESVVNTIIQATSLGLGTSAVRDVSVAYSSNDQQQYSRTIKIFRRLIWATGMLGLFVCAIFSPFWSKSSFGDYSFTFAFIILSVSLLIKQLTDGYSVLLRGSRAYKYIAKSGLIGSFVGLVVTIPIYYKYGVKGIAPALVILSLSEYIINRFYSRNIKIKEVQVSFKETIKEGRGMVVTGVLLSVQGFLTVFYAYLVRLFISNTGSIEEVGLYNAGFAIINTYVSMIFGSLSADYYPRLSSESNDTDKFNIIINQQMSLILLIVSPLILIFMVFSKVGLYMLYSDKFIGITLMVVYGIIGIFAKAPGWCLGYAFLAKGDSKGFFINEFFGALVIFIFNIVFYYIGGLNGLGLSFFIGYLYYLLQSMYFCKKRYCYNFDLKIIRLLVPHLSFCVIILVAIIFLDDVYKYIIGVPLFITSLLLSLREIQKRIDIKTFFLKKIRK